MSIRSILKRHISKFLSALDLDVYLKSLFHFPRQDIKKFVVFAQGRTGSTFLCDLLNSHPDIRCDGELLNVRWRGKRVFPAFYVKCIAKLSKLKVYGFHVKVYQLYSPYVQHKKFHQNVDPTKFLHNLHKSGWKIIYLKRSNIFRQAISNITAEESGRYRRNKKERLKLPKLTIEIERLLEYMKGREKFLNYEKLILEELPHLEIVYEEDLLINTEKGISKILEFLGVNPYPVKSQMRRTSKDDMQDYIVNYDEIIEHISKTKYSVYLK